MTQRQIVVCVGITANGKCFCRGKKDVLQMSLESGQYIDDGGWVPQQHERGFTTLVGAYQQQVWISGVYGQGRELGLEQMSCHLSRQHPFRRDPHLC